MDPLNVRIDDITGKGTKQIAVTVKTPSGTTHSFTVYYTTTMANDEIKTSAAVADRIAKLAATYLNVKEYYHVRGDDTKTKQFSVVSTINKDREVVKIDYGKKKKSIADFVQDKTTKIESETGDKKTKLTNIITKLNEINRDILSHKIEKSDFSDGALKLEELHDEKPAKPSEEKPVSKKRERGEFKLFGAVTTKNIKEGWHYKKDNARVGAVMVHDYSAEKPDFKGYTKISKGIVEDDDIIANDDNDNDNIAPANFIVYEKVHAGCKEICLFINKVNENDIKKVINEEMNAAKSSKKVIITLYPANAAVSKDIAKMEIAGKDKMEEFSYAKKFALNGDAEIKAMYSKLTPKVKETEVSCITISKMGGAANIGAEIKKADPKAKVGIMIAANSGLPGGKLEEECGNIGENVLSYKTQEESVWGNVVLTNCGVDSKNQENFFNDTIQGQWGGVDGKGNTIQGINFKTTEDANAYNQAYVVEKQKISPLKDEKGYLALDSDEKYEVTFVFADSVNAGDEGRDSGTVQRTRNTKAARDYTFFKKCVKVKLRSALDAMAEKQVTHAVVAKLSCGIYAGAHKEDIERDFEAILNEVLNEPVGQNNEKRKQYFTQVIVAGVKTPKPLDIGHGISVALRLGNINDSRANYIATVSQATDKTKKFKNNLGKEALKNTHVIASPWPKRDKKTKLEDVVKPAYGKVFEEVVKNPQGKDIIKLAFNVTDPDSIPAAMEAVKEFQAKHGSSPKIEIEFYVVNRNEEPYKTNREAVKKAMDETFNAKVDTDE